MSLGFSLLTSQTQKHFINSYFDNFTRRHGGKSIFGVSGQNDVWAIVVGVRRTAPHSGTGVSLACGKGKVKGEYLSLKAVTVCLIWNPRFSH
jgi:hypothetical protein